MATTGAELEALIAKIQQTRPDDSGAFASAAARSAYNTAFERLLRALKPRIRYFVRRYGLINHSEDAEQVGALAVHRAIASYDPAKAQFSTFVNWQIRGDMQGLRYTLMVDQRAPAKKMKASTVSLQSLLSNVGEGSDAGEFDIEDETSLDMVERGASDYLARRAMGSLLDQYVKRTTENGLRTLHRRMASSTPKRRPGVPCLKVNSLDPEQVRQLQEHAASTRDTVAKRLFEIEGMPAEDADVSSERSRQVVRQAVRALRTIVSEDAQFALMADDVPAPAKVPGRQRGPVPHTSKRGRIPQLTKASQRKVQAAALIAQAL